MGYIIALVLIIVIVPLLFMLLSRRPSGGGSGAPQSGGVTPSLPSSDEPTPGAGNINQGTAEAERRVPPG